MKVTATGVLKGMIGLFTLFMSYRLFEAIKYTEGFGAELIIFGAWFVGFVVLSLLYLMARPAR